MKVAFVTYPSAFQNVGGGEILLLKVREYVQKAGVEADLFDSWRGRVEDYSLVHVFGSAKDCLGLVRVANSRNVKVLTSPILWSDPAGHGLRHWAKVLCPVFPSLRRELLKRSDFLSPNSEMEKKLVARLFAISPEKMRVIHNGVDPSFTKADPRLFRGRFGETPFVLSVGRIEPRKNQLSLIRAVKGTGLRLVLIGSPVSGFESYEAACRREGSGFAEFIPALPHEDPMLKSAYAACRVFALQGLFETPGLAALEAALAGARVVATRGGSTREYFGDRVDYLDPTRPGRIRAAILSAWEKPADDRLKRHVTEHFTWEKIARDYVKLYQEIGGAR